MTCRRLAAGSADVDDAPAAQAVLDDAAVRDYRRRLTTLQDEITGYAGQPLGDRARIAVGKAIRRAVERVTAADPVIGAQLRATISTGTRCCYLAPS